MTGTLRFCQGEEGQNLPGLCPTGKQGWTRTDLGQRPCAASPEMLALGLHLQPGGKKFLLEASSVLSLLIGRVDAVEETDEV